MSDNASRKTTSTSVQILCRSLFSR